MGDRRASRAKDEPNLELPGRLGRRKRNRRLPAPPDDTATLPPPAEEPHDTEPTTPLYADRSEPADQDAAPAPAPAPAPPQAAAQAAAQAPPPEPAVNGGRRADRGTSRRAERGTDRGASRRPPRETTRPTAPTVPAGAASLAVGLVVGAAGALATWGSMRGCEAVRGTSSCGGGPGLLILVAIFVAMVLLGGLLLAALRVPEPRGTSFLGVGILAVIAMLVLGDTLFSRWSFVVVPLICAAAFGVGHWVTTRFVDSTEPGPDHDVR